MKHVLALATVVIMTGVGCGNGSRTPSGPSTPPEATVTSVAVTGGTPPPSAGFQLFASARLSDGSGRDVTTVSVWESSDSSLATVSAMGVVTVHGAGEVVIRATYQAVSGSLRMMVKKPEVLPPRYGLSGSVVEVLPSPRPVAGAHVEIAAGVNAGMTTTTDSNGSFALANLSPGRMTLQVVKQGFEKWILSGILVESELQIKAHLFPVPPTDAKGASATARCNDGSWSWAQSRADACASSGGIAYGVCPGPLCEPQ
jgi:hypothetical protein